MSKFYFPNRIFHLSLCLLGSLFLSAWANIGQPSLAQQSQCLCQVSQYCESQDQYYWLANSRDGGDPVLALGGLQPQLFQISLQGDRREIGRNIYVAEIPASPQNIPLALHFDDDGKVTYYRRLSQPYAELQAGLAHWNRMRYLQTLLFQDFGVSPRASERGFGTTLLIESYQIGFLTATADPSLGRHLRDLVKEYDDGLASARQFERDNRDLFTDCNSTETLCQFGPNGMAQVQSARQTLARHQWDNEFERLVRVFTRDTESSIQSLCQGQGDIESEEADDPSAMRL